MTFDEWKVVYDHFSNALKDLEHDARFEGMQNYYEHILSGLNQNLKTEEDTEKALLHILSRQ